jgi:hypothetical protein
VLSDTNSQDINTNIVTPIYTIITIYFAVWHSQYTNTNIITTIYTIITIYCAVWHTVSTQTQILLLQFTQLSPYIVLSDTHSQYTNTNIITAICTICPCHTLQFTQPTVSPPHAKHALPPSNTPNISVATQLTPTWPTSTQSPYTAQIRKGKTGSESKVPNKCSRSF